MNVSFFGVRGSTPCPCPDNRRYGGNTSCVVLEDEGAEPVVLDLGTGLRFFGHRMGHETPFVGHALVTHLHWDHVQGLPFFVPVNRLGARMDIYGPPQEDGADLAQTFDEFLKPPYFPVDLSGLAGDFRFHTLDEGEHVVGDAKVRSRLVPHVGPTNGYRVELGGVSVGYLPDIQQPMDGSMDVGDAVLDLVEGVDLLIHDAQFTPAEFADRPHWGHCTVGYALEVARRAGARRLALFHHDPDHDDATVDRLLAEARTDPAAEGIEEIFAAYEGLTVSLAPASAGV